METGRGLGAGDTLRHKTRSGKNNSVGGGSHNMVGQETEAEHILKDLYRSTWRREKEGREKDTRASLVRAQDLESDLDSNPTTYLFIY